MLMLYKTNWLDFGLSIEFHGCPRVNWYTHFNRISELVASTHHNEERLSGGALSSEYFGGKDSDTAIVLPLVVEGGAGELPCSREVDPPIAVEVEVPGGVPDGWKSVRRRQCETSAMHGLEKYMSCLIHPTLRQGLPVNLWGIVFVSFALSFFVLPCHSLLYSLRPWLFIKGTLFGSVYILFFFKMMLPR